jgi:hypothetical protein
MRISSAYDGGCAVVRLAGRLDGESGEQFSDTLDRLLRDGQRSVLLDMSGVNYLSSPRPDARADPASRRERRTPCSHPSCAHSETSGICEDTFMQSSSAIGLSPSALSISWCW